MLSKLAINEEIDDHLKIIKKCNHFLPVISENYLLAVMKPVIEKKGTKVKKKLNALDETCAMRYLITKKQAGICWHCIKLILICV